MSVSRVYRLLRLITLLQSGRGYTVDELAKELEVSRRTVFRDLNMLELAHIPYYFDRERQAYRINNHFFLPPVNLTLAEALSLMVLATRQWAMSPLPLAAEAQRAGMKVQSVLPAPVRQHVGEMLEHMKIRPAPAARHDGPDGCFDRLAAATASHKVCCLEYASFYEGQRLGLTVHPLRLVFVHRAWYLLAWSRRHEQIRTFKLGRILKLEVLDEEFEPPAPAVVDDHFGAAWSMIPEGTLHDVQLRFASLVAGNVAEVQWHPSQRVEWRDDGSLDFHATVDGLGEISWWVLGYGDQVRVLHPPELARRVRDAAVRVAAQYELPPPGEAEA